MATGNFGTNSCMVIGRLVVSRKNFPDQPITMLARGCWYPGSQYPLFPGSGLPVVNSSFLGEEGVLCDRKIVCQGGRRGCGGGREGEEKRMSKKLQWFCFGSTTTTITLCMDSIVRGPCFMETLFDADTGTAH